MAQQFNQQLQLNNQLQQESNRLQQESNKLQQERIQLQQQYNMLQNRAQQLEAILTEIAIPAAVIEEATENEEVQQNVIGNEVSLQNGDADKHQ